MAMWDIDTGSLNTMFSETSTAQQKKVSRLPLHPLFFSSLYFSQRFADRAAFPICVVALQSLSPCPLQAHDKSVKTVLMSSDASFALSVGDDRCRLLGFECSPLCHASYSSVRYFVCACCTCRAIKLWDLRRGGMLKRVDVSCVRFINLLVWMCLDHRYFVRTHEPTLFLCPDSPRSAKLCHTVGARRGLFVGNA